MREKQNLHTHSSYCDGKDTPEELVLYAINKGFSSIGFSSHISPKDCRIFGYTSNLNGYIKEIQRLQLEYGDKIKIYLGAEKDAYSSVESSAFQYVIGSVHMSIQNNVPIFFDHDIELCKKAIIEVFDGDVIKYIQAYYDTVASLPNRFDFQIVGHFDVITKFNDREKLFDSSDKIYKNIALEALHTIIKKVNVFEVNTGAMARGFRTTPYPEIFLLKEIKRLGGNLIITSDCHDKNKLDYGFDTTTELLKSIGYRETLILEDNGFKEVPL